MLCSVRCTICVSGCPPCVEVNRNGASVVAVKYQVYPQNTYVCTHQVVPGKLVRTYLIVAHNSAWYAMYHTRYLKLLLLVVLSFTYIYIRVPGDIHPCFLCISRLLGNRSHLRLRYYYYFEVITKYIVYIYQLLCVLGNKLTINYIFLAEA